MSPLSEREPKAKRELSSTYPNVWVIGAIGQRFPKGKRERALICAFAASVGYFEKS